MTLELIDKLIKVLEIKGISYCHWKSNTACQKTLLGINDLDILVDMADKEEFISVMSQLNFVRVVSSNENWFPPICHYYGYDAASEKIVHVHLHHKLILGYDLIKNYHIPVEKALLDSATHCSNLKTPSDELELIVFVIRMVLKQRLLPLVLGHPRHWFKAIAGKGRDALPQADREDLANLREKTDSEKLKKCLYEHFPFLSVELFAFCLASIDSQGRKYSWFTAGKRLTGVLRAYRRYSAVSSVVVPIKRSFVRRLDSLLCWLGWRKPRKKRLACGGKLIAFVGGDGAGKTTNIEAVNSWFGRYFDVHTVHIGKPARSVLNYTISVFLKIWQIIAKSKGQKFCQAVIYWLVAYDRWNSFRIAKKLSAKGAIVCLDRIPIPGITTMDIPRIRSKIGDVGIYSWLANSEQDYHSRIRGVDKLFMLKLDPKIALERIPDDDKEQLLRRSSEIWEDKWLADDAYVVDAGRPLDEVKREIRDQLWKLVHSRHKVVEIIGLAGSGKSIVTKKLEERTRGIQVHLSVRAHKIRYFRHTLKLLPMLFNLWRQKVPMTYLKSAINTETTLDVLRSSENQAVFTGKAIVLDQGPVFWLASAQISWSSKINNEKILCWLRNTAEKVSDLFDMVIWLDASNNTLRFRINDRKQEHRIKNLPQEQTDEFLDNYRSCFEHIIGGGISKPIPVKCISTEENSVEEVVAKVIEFLEAEDANECCKKQNPHPENVS